MLSCLHISKTSLMSMACLRVSLNHILGKGNLSAVYRWRMSSFSMSAAANTVAGVLKDKAYVGGQWVSAKSGKTYKVVNPATGEVIADVPDMDRTDAATAIDVAYKTFHSWKDTPHKERCNVLKKWYELCMAKKKELATLITLEMGKPLADSEGEVLYSAGFLEWYGEEAKRIYGDVTPCLAPNKRVLLFKQPIGVAGMITPWNFPGAMITRKAGAAIAAGCTVVLRPAEDTPLTALALAQLAEEAGIPAGVLNIITSDRGGASPIGKELCENPLVSKISFTGSTNVGKILLAQGASTVKKMSLELGGNAPFIVFDSADIDKAVQGLIACKFRCSGQTCVSANRVLVQDGVYDAFVAALHQAMAGLKMGNGLDPEVNQGPLINEQAVAKVDSLVKGAVGQGANLVTGGTSRDNFYTPTLLSEVTTAMNVTKLEMFGPVVSALRFKTEEEAVAIANSTEFGLAAYFYTSDIGQVWRVSENLQYGIIGVNEGLLSGTETTFGGWKQSGLGREGGRYGIDEYLEMKNVTFGNITK